MEGTLNTSNEYGSAYLISLRVEGMGVVRGWVEWIADDGSEIAVKTLRCIANDGVGLTAETHDYEVSIDASRVIAWAWTDLDETKHLTGAL